MPDPRTQIVADGYDAMGETFAAWQERIVGDPRRVSNSRSFASPAETALRDPVREIEGLANVEA